ncbi:RNA-binding protein [Rhizobium sp. CF142]|uniref:RNA-binding protein n=1 Tax=Rhizobium sp. CF142 TaxID=1144314 RepID=UPI00026EEEB5|nr:RNA-binding protein [Rhizobium sp. CF142]EJJ30744.1 putative nucleic-acid-binding protein implicated in transcription termination [Rhizobium sp. CF142]
MTLTPDTSPEDDDLAGYDVNGRMCIATRESGSPDELIRFVAAPDGTVVPDLKRELPGRGCWVKIDRSLVERAVAKKLFARALKADVKAADDLGERVERLFLLQLLQMMNMARKAGQLVTGSAKVDAAIRSGAALAVFHSTEAAADGVRKIDQARKAWHLGMETEEEIPSFRLFSESEMEGVMGQNAFIHAAVLAGQAGEGVVKRAKMLEQYRNGGQSRAPGGAGQQKQ